MTEKPTCVDLFSGAGGLSLGFERAGFEVAAAVDRSESAIKTYSANFPETTTIQVDAKEFDSELLEEKSEYSASDIDLVLGGPPCKGFSVAGKMDPDDPRNKLVVHYANIVEDLNPDAIVLENVTGLLQMANGEYAQQLRNVLNNLGYNIPKPYILTAADYGVPQLRERVIFMGTKEGPIEPPERTHSPSEGQKKLEDSENRQDYVTIGEAVSDLAFLGPGEESSSYEDPPVTEYQKNMREDANELYNHVAPNHGERVQHRYSLFDHGDKMDDIPEEHQTSKHSMVRWDPKLPAPTVTTLPEDFVHYEQNRIPTVREIARIQSFPDDFVFEGPRTTGGKRRRNSVPQYTQVGNAVPPLFAEAIAKQVYEEMASETVEKPV